MRRLRRSALTTLGCALVMVLVGLALAALLASAGPSPMVDPPTSYGPYAIGYTYDTIRPSTNGYDTYLKTYYPAVSAGRDTRPDASAAPYPCVVWLPGTGGTRESYQGYLGPLCSWGFVVVAVGYNHNYFPSSCDAQDLEETLDYMEALNANESRALYGMVDTSAFGLSGHSAGGGLSLYYGAYVDRFKVVQTLAAAIQEAAVDSVAPHFQKPVLMQVGKLDTSYIDGSRRAWRMFSCTRSLFEIIGGTHVEGFQGDVFFSFFLYYLAGKDEYREFVYGDHVIDRYLDGAYDLWFQVNETGEFFPPRVTASVDPAVVDMDSPVALNGTIEGRYIAGDPRGNFTWDFDIDAYDIQDHVETDRVVVFDDVLELNVTFSYTIGRLTARAPGTLHISVRNVEPVAAFSDDDVTVDMDSAVFLNASATTDTPSDIGRLECLWDFGDGELPTTTTSLGAFHAYAAPGDYTVALAVTDPHGAMSVATMAVHVLDVPPLPVVPADQSAFEDDVVDLLGSAVDTPSDQRRLRYSWEFGDGSGTEWSPSGAATHAYARSGTYALVLSVKDPWGALANATMTVKVSNRPPECVVASPEGGSSFEEDVEVPFEGRGSDTPSDRDGLDYMWEFGDGSATDWGGAANASASHAYARSGTYRARLAVRDDDGAETEAFVNLTVLNVPPSASIVRPASAPTVDEDTTIQLEGEGSDGPSDAPLLEYWWDLDGQPVGDERAVALAFPSSGRYVITFSARDPEGAVASASISVTVVNLPPWANATVGPLAVGVGEPVRFCCTVGDTPSDLLGLSVEWDLGDGSMSSLATGTHTYSSAGNYTVRLTVTDDDLVTASREFTVSVQPPPPPPPPDDGDGTDAGAGDNGRTVIIGIALLVAVAVVAAVVLLMRRPPLSADAPPLTTAQG